MKISSVKYLLGEGIRNVWTNRVMSLASFCVMMVSLLLVGFSVLFTANVNRVISGIESKNEMIVFLTDGATADEISTLQTAIGKLDNVASIELYSKEQAFDDMKAQYENADELFAYIDESPLPDAYKLKITDVSQMNTTINNIKSNDTFDIIYKINSPNDFADLLMGIKSTLAAISSVVIVALAAVSFVIISNASRASVFARRKEISIMKYVGATNAFIKIPFFIEGMVMGILAGIVAGFVTWFGYTSLIDLLSKEMTLWQAFGVKEFIPFSAVVVKVFAYYILAGGLLGAVGSAISTQKHLKV